MKIQFSRTGGFAGIKTQLTLDLADLPAAGRKAMEMFIDKAGFFELPAECRSPRPDAFQYLVAVEHEGRRHQVRADEAAVPEKLRPLLDRLMELAREETGKKPKS